MHPDTKVAKDPFTPIAGPSPLLRLLASLGRPEELHGQVTMTPTIELLYKSTCILNCIMRLMTMRPTTWIDMSDKTTGFILLSWRSVLFPSSLTISSILSD